MRRVVLALALVVGWCSSARAETLPVLIGVPDSYAPGTSFTFEVRVPELFDYASYSIELLFDTQVENPPLFASSSAVSSRYPFPDTTGFQSTLTTFADSTQIILTFADSTSPPVNVSTGGNDTLARVTVQPGATMTGSITISIGTGTLFDYNLEASNPHTPGPVVVEQGDANPPGEAPGTAVPAPASAVLLGIGGLLLAIRVRLCRNQNAC